MKEGKKMKVNEGREEEEGECREGKKRKVNEGREEEEGE